MSSIRYSARVTFTKRVNGRKSWVHNRPIQELEELKVRNFEYYIQRWKKQAHSLTPIPIKLSPLQGHRRSMRLSIGIELFTSLSCTREKCLRRSTLPLNHQPGTDTRLKSNNSSTRKPPSVRASLELRVSYTAHGAPARHPDVPYNDGCCGTRMMARPPGSNDCHRLRNARFSSGTCSSTLIIRAVSNFSSRPLKSPGIAGVDLQHAKIRLTERIRA